MRIPTLSCLLLATLAAGTAFARPPARVPADADQVIERLPRGYAALEPRGGATATPTVEAIIGMLSAAARSGDARLARRADAMLAAFPDRDEAPLLATRAFAAQHRHDFAAAVSLLDRAIAADPRDGGLRLSRAQVALVQGRVHAARRDCGALAVGIDAGLGLACTAAVALRTGHHDVAARLAEQWLASDASRAAGHSALPRGGMRIYVLLLRAEAAARAGDPGAERWYRAALALDRGDVRTLAATARFLLAQGRAIEVAPLLKEAGDSDGIALLRTLAAHATGDGAERFAALQAERYALSRRLGLPTELRDEAEFALTVRGDADAALALAQRNFASQRDHEDVRLLQRVAARAHQPQALAAAREWSRAEGVPFAEAAP
jgi:tetratricopeptide (TPR) repeat protein